MHPGLSPELRQHGPTPAGGCWQWQWHVASFRLSGLSEAIRRGRSFAISALSLQLQLHSTSVHTVYLMPVLELTTRPGPRWENLWNKKRKMKSTESCRTKDRFRGLHVTCRDFPALCLCARELTCVRARARESIVLQRFTRQSLPASRTPLSSSSYTLFLPSRSAPPHSSLVWLGLLAVVPVSPSSFSLN